MNSVDISSIISNINGLYNNLVAYTVGIMLFAGALIPGVISFFLNRQIRIEQESTTKRLLLELAAAKKELADTLENKVKAEVEAIEQKVLVRIAELQAKFDEKIASAEGGQYHIQGNGNLKQEYFSLAASDFVTAASFYVDGKNELNLQRVLRILNEDCLKKLDKTDFEEDINLEVEIRNLLEKINGLNQNGRYHDISSNLTKSLNAALKREKE